MTQKQHETLRLIVLGFLRDQRCPTNLELQEALGLSARHSVRMRMATLARNGYITLEPGISRGIRITPLGFDAAGVPGMADALEAAIIVIGKEKTRPPSPETGPNPSCLPKREMQNARL